MPRQRLLLPPSAVPAPAPRRRTLLGAGAALAGTALLPPLAGCATPLPLVPPRPGTAAGAARLRACADAHGAAAFAAIDDIAVAYTGQWYPVIERIQPEVVDIGFRIASQERLLPRAGVNAQSYRGPAGVKHVAWQRGGGGGAPNGPGRIAVWRNGVADTRADTLSASALVAECYALFLLGPLWAAARGAGAELDGTERVDGRLCDRVVVWATPGFGLSASDRVVLCVDRDGDLLRRLRFTLEGHPSTRGAVAEVDVLAHERRFGVVWPRRSFERVVHPLRLAAHGWEIAGLDVNRGFTAADVTGPDFTGRAAAPAALW